MNVQVDGPSTVAPGQIKQLAPGYLFTPFGWAAQPLAAIVESEPELLTQLFELDRSRMHVIALAGLGRANVLVAVNARMGACCRAREDRRGTEKTRPR